MVRSGYCDKLPLAVAIKRLLSFANPIALAMNARQRYPDSQSVLTRLCFVSRYGFHSGPVLEKGHRCVAKWSTRWVNDDTADSSHFRRLVHAHISGRITCQDDSSNENDRVNGASSHYFHKPHCKLFSVVGDDRVSRAFRSLSGPKRELAAEQLGRSGFLVKPSARPNRTPHQIKRTRMWQPGRPRRAVWLIRGNRDRWDPFPIILLRWWALDHLNEILRADPFRERGAHLVGGERIVVLGRAHGFVEGKAEDGAPEQAVGDVVLAGLS